MVDYEPFVDAFLVCREVRHPTPNETDLIGIIDTHLVGATGHRRFKIETHLYIDVRHDGRGRDWPLTIRVRIPNGEVFDVSVVPFHLGAGERSVGKDVTISLNAEQFGEHLISLVSAAGAVVARTIVLVEEQHAQAAGLH
jgi:hypothetical protein